jgi:hypothetical protein
MMHAHSLKLSAGMALAIVLWQAASCCCCLGGAVTPAMTPAPISGDLAAALRDRVNEARQAEGPFEIAFTDQELTSYVVGLLQSGAGQFPARDMQIRFGDGVVEIWATFIDVAPTDLPTYIRATVDAVDGQLVLRIEQANAGAFPVPGAMRETIAQTLSETLAELQLGVWVDRVTIVPGQATVAGQVTGEVPALP